MRYTAATTIQLFVAALITLSAGAAVKRDCQTLEGLIRLNSSDYLTAVGSQNVVFAPVTSSDTTTVFEFEYCDDGPFEISYLNGAQIAGLLGAVLVESVGINGFPPPPTFAYLADVSNTDYHLSQSTIWNYDPSTGLISAILDNGNGSLVDPLAVLSDVGIQNTVTGTTVYPVALVFEGNEADYTTFNMTFISTNGSSSPPSSSSSAPTSLTPTSTTSEPTPSTSPTASGSVPTATSSLYDQCGGINWTGSRQCGSALVCVSEGDYYSQCYILDPNTILNADGTTGDGSDSQPTQTIYGQCGGAGWTGITQCASGLVCVAQNLDPGYSQCLTLDMNSIPSRVAE